MGSRSVLYSTKFPDLSHLSSSGSLSALQGRVSPTQVQNLYLCFRSSNTDSGRLYGDLACLSSCLSTSAHAAFRTYLKWDMTLAKLMTPLNM